MKNLVPILVFAIAFLPFKCLAAFERSTLKTALENGWISIAATGSGKAFNQAGLHLNIKNKTKKALQLTIDPALVFQPIDTAFQDLILPGETFVLLASSGESELDIQSFCGKSNARAPGRALVFHFAHQGDSTMIKVAQFINKYGLYNGTGQSAIWALTNYHNLSGIYDPANPTISNKLVALMAQLTGWPVPDYFKLYKTNTVAGEPVMEARILKIYSVFEWKLAVAKKLTLGIYNSSNKLIQPVMENKEFIKGGYKLTVEFEAENIAPGKYYIRLKNGNLVMKEQMVQLD